MWHNMAATKSFTPLTEHMVAEHSSYRSPHARSPRTRKPNEMDKEGKRMNALTDRIINTFEVAPRRIGRSLRMKRMLYIDERRPSPQTGAHAVAGSHL